MSEDPLTKAVAFFTGGSKKPAKTKALAKIKTRKTKTIVAQPVIPKKITVVPASGGLMVNTGPVEIKINGKKRAVTARQLCNTIKYLTQQIGSYKSMNTLYTEIAVDALRKARRDTAAILEENFGIIWEIDPHSGQSTFYAS